jgi:hypothetical protein
MPDHYPFFSPSTRTKITVRVLLQGTPPATYVPAGLRESLLGSNRRSCSGSGVGTGPWGGWRGAPFPPSPKAR